MLADLLAQQAQTPMPGQAPGMPPQGGQAPMGIMMELSPEEAQMVEAMRGGMGPQAAPQAAPMAAPMAGPMPGMPQGMGPMGL